ncbi:MAG: hypothetical protein RLZZ15_1147 [Verrucomicrobiota bacterium]|jgi:2-polyprenyl-6-methoxyphenol hydroxylase-like FAD-dependent oxidoreductase
MIAPAPIEIVGGGLAGLSLGLALRRADVPTTIFEAGNYPRHRVCGEFITGLAPTTIARLGLAPIFSDAQRHHEAAWFHGDSATPVRVQRLPSPALALSRHTLDARLAAAFVDAGGVLHTHTRVADAPPRAGRVFANGRRRGQPEWLGLKLHASALPLAHDLELHLGDDCYVGLARVAPDTVNVCGLFRVRTLAATGNGLLLAYLRAAGLTTLADRLAAASLDATSFSAVAALAFDASVHVAADEPLRLGDACAMIPPFTGNGMAMAFQSAELALDPLRAFSRGEAPWPDTVAAVRGALDRRFRRRLRVASLLHPFLHAPPRQRFFATLARSPLLPLRPLYAALH